MGKKKLTKQQFAIMQNRENIIFKKSFSQLRCDRDERESGVRLTKGIKMRSNGKDYNY